MIYFVAPTMLLFFNILISAVSAFSPAEQNALEKLRPLVSDALYRDYTQEDVYLVQWLRTTKLDPAKANQAIRKTHLWRKEKNIDALLGEDWSKFEKEFPYIVDGHDKEGRPLMYMNFGPAWDLRKAALKGQKDELIRYMERIAEKTSNKARATFNETVPTATGVRDVPDWIGIHDLQGYTLKQNGCLACIPIILGYAVEGDKYYGYSLKNSYSFNTPKIFENVLQLIRNLMSEHLNNLLKVYGTDKREFMEHFSTIIAPDQLKLHFKY